MITRKEAVKVAHEMRREGKTYQEIAQALADKGLRSDKSGEPFTEGGIHSLMHSKKKSSAKAKTSGSVRHRAMEAILALDIDAESKVALLELISDLKAA